jgi:uncharacterized protein (DUF302 family)
LRIERQNGMGYTKTIRLDLPYAQAVPRVKEALKARGFGTLTEIDVRATLEEKLGETMEPYLIIGACNPGLAHRALDAERSIGTLLPCNVVVRQADDHVIVEAMDPGIMVQVTENPAVKPIADEAAGLIDEALRELAGTPGGR